MKTRKPPWMGTAHSGRWTDRHMTADRARELREECLDELAAAEEAGLTRWADAFRRRADKLADLAAAAEQRAAKQGKAARAFFPGLAREQEMP
jgi:hypothetical protein